MIVLRLFQQLLFRRIVVFITRSSSSLLDFNVNTHTVVKINLQVKFESNDFRRRSRSVLRVYLPLEKSERSSKCSRACYAHRNHVNHVRRTAVFYSLNDVEFINKRTTRKQDFRSQPYRLWSSF